MIKELGGDVLGSRWGLAMKVNNAAAFSRFAIRRIWPAVLTRNNITASGTELCVPSVAAEQRDIRNNQLM